MKFSFKNVGVIAKAEIEVKGLTVITGLNDTGKSFLSKSIFGIVKTVSDSSQQELNDKIQSINIILGNISIQARQLGLLKIEESIAIFRNEIIASLIQKLPTNGILNTVKGKKLEVINFVNESKTGQNLASFVQAAETNFNTIERLLTSEKDDLKRFKDFFENLIIQELFKNQISNLSSPGQELEINCSEGSQNLLSIKVTNNKVTEFTSNDPQKLLYQDATLIESPVVVQLVNFLVQFSLGSQRRNVPMHFTDLVRKLIVPSLRSNVNIDVIASIIKGRVVYDEKARNIVFQNLGGFSIDAVNTATGIKSFGIIQLLLNSGAINTKSILIIDEPEVHLHPKWEVEYAKLIASMVKEGIPIVLSSHSAYFLKAIAKYVRERELASVTKFYFGENDGTSSTFKEVTENLEPIFNTLAKPMEELF